MSCQITWTCIWVTYSQWVFQGMREPDYLIVCSHFTIVEAEAQSDKVAMPRLLASVGNQLDSPGSAYNLVFYSDLWSTSLLMLLRTETLSTQSSCSAMCQGTLGWLMLPMTPMLDILNWLAIPEKHNSKTNLGNYLIEPSTILLISSSVPSDTVASSNWDYWTLDRCLVW